MPLDWLRERMPMPGQQITPPLVLPVRRPADVEPWRGDGNMLGEPMGDTHGMPAESRDPVIRHRPPAPVNMSGGRAGPPHTVPMPTARDHMGDAVRALLDAHNTAVGRQAHVMGEAPARATANLYTYATDAMRPAADPATGIVMPRALTEKPPAAREQSRLPSEMQQRYTPANPEFVQEARAWYYALPKQQQDRIVAKHRADTTGMNFADWLYRHHSDENGRFDRSAANRAVLRGPAEEARHSNMPVDPNAPIQRQSPAQKAEAAAGGTRIYEATGEGPDGHRASFRLRAFPENGTVHALVKSLTGGQPDRVRIPRLVAEWTEDALRKAADELGIPNHQYPSESPTSMRALRSAVARGVERQFDQSLSSDREMTENGEWTWVPKQPLREGEAGTALTQRQRDTRARSIVGQFAVYYPEGEARENFIAQVNQLAAEGKMNELNRLVAQAQTRQAAHQETVRRQTVAEFHLMTNPGRIANAAIHGEPGQQIGAMGLLGIGENHPQAVAAMEQNRLRGEQERQNQEREDAAPQRRLDEADRQRAAAMSQGHLSDRISAMQQWHLQHSGLVDEKGRPDGLAARANAENDVLDHIMQHGAGSATVAEEATNLIKSQSPAFVVPFLIRHGVAGNERQAMQIIETLQDPSHHDSMWAWLKAMFLAPGAPRTPPSFVPIEPRAPARRVDEGE